MERASLNSLVQVGIALNVGFGAFKSIHDAFYERFDRMLGNRVQSIRVTLLETNPDNPDADGAVLLDAKEISKRYSDSGKRATTLLITLALLDALFSTGYLAYSASEPLGNIPDWSLWICLIFVLGPILVGFVLQLGFFLGANWALNKTVEKYDHYFSVRDQITPKPPTN